MSNIKDALKLAKDCTFADEMTEGAKEYLRNKIDEALEELYNLEVQMNVRMLMRIKSQRKN